MPTGPIRVALLRHAGLLAGAAACLLPQLHAIVDRDANQQSDIWQLVFATGVLAPGADADGDGYSNLAESLAGTDPRDPRSAPALKLEGASDPALLQLRWSSLLGKRYELFTTPALAQAGSWASAGVYLGNDTAQLALFSPSGLPAAFFRLAIADLDTDGDGLADWEERRIGFDPNRRNTDGYGTTTVVDLNRVNTALAATNTVTVAALDPAMAENWPDPGIVAVRRTGNLDPIVVNFTIGGTATAGSDFQGPVGGTIALGLGVDEAWLTFTPLADAVAEGEESVIVTVAPGAGYTIGGVNSATLTLADSTAGAVSRKEAVRFLAQATFGATEAEILRVQQLGIAGWIAAQLARVPQTHLPLVEQWQAEFAAAVPAASASSTHRTEVWWRRALQDDAASDPLRQRVAHALSQILVVSDRNSSLDASPRGMAAYHDRLLVNSFGNYRDLLRDVTLQPLMGIYLSHLRNQKADPARNRYPDENYAREIMQLFSIGLWELNPDGSRPLDADGEPIATYDNDTIAAFARVFTGLSYGKRFTSGTDFTVIPTTSFFSSFGLAWEPMRGFDAYHDLAEKRLLRGTVLPARTASVPDTGAATMADVDAAMENLFNHPNVGPFLCRQLIQRLVTSNPSPEYIARIAGVFADNGAGVRGDLGAVVRALLLDTEARDPARLAVAGQGMQREPYLRYVALVRALGGPTTDGRRRGFRGLDGEFLQRAYSAPSVFNFYLPDYQPLGVLKDAGLVGPEFQITNGVTGITAPNRFYSAATSTTFRLNSSGEVDPLLDTRINPAPWLDDATNNPEALVARLDRLLAAGELSPRSLRHLCRAVRRLPDPLTTADPTLRTTRATDRFRMALYLVLVSPEFCVLK